MRDRDGNVIVQLPSKEVSGAPSGPRFLLRHRNTRSSMSISSSLFWKGRYMIVCMSSRRSTSIDSLKRVLSERNILTF